MALARTEEAAESEMAEERRESGRRPSFVNPRAAEERVLVDLRRGVFVANSRDGRAVSEGSGEGTVRGEGGGTVCGLTLFVSSVTVLFVFSVTVLSALLFIIEIG